jgi:CDP-glycerol glycerophosphotransferase (TagB/SpsB family)
MKIKVGINLIFDSPASKGGSRDELFINEGCTISDLLKQIGLNPEKEYEFVRDNFGFDKNEVIYTGFARFDFLHNRQEKNDIVLMPTWRRGFSAGKYGGGNDRQNFIHSEYYRAYQSLINNPKFIHMLQENNYRLIFYPHYEIQQFLDCFTTDSKQIIIAGKDDYDVRKLLKESKMMITDYSSVAMDFAYMEKPIIYYQFDKEQFRKMHWKKGYFSYEEDGFGPVLETEEQVIDDIEVLFSRGMVNTEEYINKSREFFALKDKHNCDRIFKAIQNLK